MFAARAGNTYEQSGAVTINPTIVLDHASGCSRSRGFERVARHVGSIAVRGVQARALHEEFSVSDLANAVALQTAVAYCARVTGPTLLLNVRLDPVVHVAEPDTEAAGRQHVSACLMFGKVTTPFVSLPAQRTMSCGVGRGDYRVDQ